MNEPYYKRRQPGEAPPQGLGHPLPKDDVGIPPSATTHVQDGGFYTRSQPGGRPSQDPTQSPLESDVEIPASPPPFTQDEEEACRELAGPRSERLPSMTRFERSANFRRFVFSLIGAAFGLLAFFLVLETIQAVGTILLWPYWAAYPILILIGGALLYTAYRAIRMAVGFRRLAKVDFHPFRDFSKLSPKDRDSLRASMKQQLDYIKRNPDAYPSEISRIVNDLLGDKSSGGADAWLREYRDALCPELRNLAMEEIRKISIFAGVSASLTPWRLMDAFIAINASLECASSVLRVFGIRPDSTAIASCAFDALVATFFATTMEEAAEEAVAALPDSIQSNLGQKIAEYAAPKMAQGIAVAFFVHRIGRRMVRNFVGK